MLVAILLSSAGCSGINTGASVSPASFFLPGLMQAEPSKTDILGSPPVEQPKQFALAR
jgi:hypothetical protein